MTSFHLFQLGKDGKLKKYLTCFTKLFSGQSPKNCYWIKKVYFILFKEDVSQTSVCVTKTYHYLQTVFKLFSWKFVLIISNIRSCLPKFPFGTRKYTNIQLFRLNMRSNRGLVRIICHFISILILLILLRGYFRELLW